MFVFRIGSVHLFTESFVSCLLPYYSLFGDKATTSASPSRVLDFQDGFALLFSSFIPWFSTFCRFNM